MMSLHSYFSSHWITKLMSLIIYFLFGLGVVLTSLYNSNLIHSYGNTIGLIFVVFGLLGIIGLCIVRICNQLLSIKKSALNSQPLTTEDCYIYLLFGNLFLRLIVYGVVGNGDGDARSAQVQPYFIILNTITVVIISTINSRQLTIEFTKTMIRLEKKRNFVRYISQ